LQTQACAHECKRDISVYVPPRRVSTVTSDAAFTTLPETDAGGSEKNGLKGGTEHQPTARVSTDSVTNPTHNYAKVKRKQRCECLSVGNVKCEVSLTWRALKKPRNGESELTRLLLVKLRREIGFYDLTEITSLETAPYKYGREGYGIATIMLSETAETILRDSHEPSHETITTQRQDRFRSVYILSHVC
jgi:hypothetical protein